MVKTIPERFLKTTPNGKSVIFRGDPINLSILAVALDIHHSQLSRLFSGERRPSIEIARKLAHALGLGLEEFVDSLPMKRAS